MPVETKSSPLFTIGPFVPSNGHVPLWTNGSGTLLKSDIDDPPPGRGGGGSSSDGGSSRGESPDLVLEIQTMKLQQQSRPQQLNGTMVSPEPNATCTTTSEPHSDSQSNGHSPLHVDVHEKPALPPRPSHLTTSSNHRRRSSNPVTPRSRPTPHSPTSPLTSSPVLTEKEYIERIAKLQMDNLIPLKEDVSDWLNRILKVPDITVDNFMDRLDNGVIVCKLAKLIEAECNLVLPSGHQTTVLISGRGVVKGGGKNGSQVNECVTPPMASPGKPIQEILSRYYVAPSPRANRISSMEGGSGAVLSSASVPFTASTMKCWENAKSRTFFARDNVSNFLNWCRLLGVKDAVLFETEDLVSHVNQRNVVLCLLEVARIACTRHSFSPAPGLVEFEQEIDREIEKELKREEEKKKLKELKALKKCQVEAQSTDNGPVAHNHEESGFLEPLSNGKLNGALPEVDQGGVPLEDLEEEDEVTLHNSRPLSSGSNVDETDRGSLMDEETSATESEEHHCNNSTSPEVRSPSPTNSVISSASSTYLDPNMTGGCGASTSSGASHSSTPTPMTSELDHKVMQIAKTYYGKEARQGVQRLSEGKYKIANRIVFVRLLKARHVMVRVGGGWTTLSHFLVRHGGDPNQEILPDELLPLDTKPSSSQPRRRSSSTHTLVIPGNALHYTSSKTPTPTPGSVTPTTPYHPQSRYINSTPVSRRSSISSPEPSIGSSTSGYSSSGNSTSNAPTDTKIPIFCRRQRLPSLQLSHEPFRNRSTSTMSINGLPRSTSSTILSGPGSELSASNSSIPRSTLGSRYINYLASSQHITRRLSNSNNSNIPVNMNSPLGSTASPNANHSGGFTTPPKQLTFTAVRKTAQKTF